MALALPHLVEDEADEDVLVEPEQRDLEGNPTGQTTFDVEEDDV
jgi:hypothetical protein